MTTENLVWIILLAPIAGFLIQSLLGGSIVKAGGKRLAGVLAVLPIAVSFVAGALIASRLAGSTLSDLVTGPNWISVPGLQIPFEFLVDPLSITMVLIITGVGSLIHVYSTAYMAEDREYTRFFTYMNLFIAAMLVLVLGNNLALLFIGWEGVGLCSYLLIGFWYKDLANAKAANKAFIVNRIGDWGLMLGLFLIVAVVASAGTGTDRLLSYDSIESALKPALAAQPALATTIALLLFVGAAGKSAQFPLYVWLPDAMAGPTPVSALIHAATMVTSGVFLLNRMHFVFEASPIASAVICLVGAFTAAFAAVIAFGQTDIKKVLAYSTVSQLGFMFIACGAGAYWAGMFHVVTHAFFKALLFLGAGAVIYSMSHNQDLRNYGNLRKYLPITFLTMCAAWLAISGFPFFSGYFSKEAILGSALGSNQAVANEVNFGPIAGWIGLGVALLTAVYMTRLMSLTFLGKEERWRSLPAADHAHSEEIDEDHHDLGPDHQPKEAPISMTLVLAVLALLSIFAGWLNYNGWFEKWLSPPAASQIPEASLPLPLPLMSGIAAIGGLIIGLAFYMKGLPKDQGFDVSAWQRWRVWAGEQFGFDNLLTMGAIEGGRDIATVLDEGVEKGFIDRIVNGVGAVSVAVGSVLKSVQTGAVRLYALVMLIGGVAFLGYFVYVVWQLGAVR